MKIKYIAISAAVIATISGVSYAAMPNKPVQMVSEEPTTTEVKLEAVETQPAESVEATPTEGTTTEQPAGEQSTGTTTPHTPTQTSQPAQAPAAPAPQQPPAVQAPAPTPTPPAPKIVSKTMHYVDINATQQDGYCTYVWSDGHVAVQRIGTRQTPGNGVMHIELNCFSSYR